MIDILGWNSVLFIARWVFIGLIYLFLFVVVFAVRRELSVRVRTGQPAGRVVPGRLRVINIGTDHSLKPGDILDLRVETQLGAELDNDLVLRDQYVSGHHARLRWDGAAWWVEDLGSQNGTLVNQTACYPNVPARAPVHAILALGDMSFELLEP